MLDKDTKQQTIRQALIATLVWLAEESLELANATAATDLDTSDIEYRQVKFAKLAALAMRIVAGPSSASEGVRALVRSLGLSTVDADDKVILIRALERWLEEPPPLYKVHRELLRMVNAGVKPS